MMSQSTFPSFLVTRHTSVGKRIYNHRIHIRILLMLMVVALFAPFLANENPILVKYSGRWYFPALHESVLVTDEQNNSQRVTSGEWKNLDTEFKIQALIPYSSRSMDFDNAQSLGPFDKQNISSLRFRHWLGTDELGRDVLAGLIHGTMVSVKVGLIAMTIALLLGGLIGVSAGYLGDYTLSVSIGVMLSRLMGFLLFLYYGIFIHWNGIISDQGNSQHEFFNVLLTLGIGVCIFFLSEFVSRILKFISPLNKHWKVPVDLFNMRLVEILVSVPPLFLILAVVAVTKPSLGVVSVIAGCIYSAVIAKYFRSEILKIKSNYFIEAANALGYSRWRIVWRHLVPNAATPVLIALAFGFANMILLESSLSFLGIGLPADTVSWGSLLSGARNSPTSWWLAIFPGLAIFATVYALNRIGEYYTDILSLN